MLDKIFKVTCLKPPESNQSRGEAGGGSTPEREESAGCWSMLLLFFRERSTPRVRVRGILRKICWQEESEVTRGAAGVARN